MPLTTRQAATAGFSVKKFLALLKDRTVIQDERFLLWELRSGGGKISYDAADTGDRINTYYAARGIKLDEEDEKEVKALANELLQPGNALYFDELKSDAFPGDSLWSSAYFFMYMTVLKEAQAKFMATPEFAVLAACLLIDDEAALIMVAGLPKNDPLAIFYSNFGPRTRKTLVEEKPGLGNPTQTNPTGRVIAVTVEEKMVNSVKEIFRKPIDLGVISAYAMVDNGTWVNLVPAVLPLKIDGKRVGRSALKWFRSKLRDDAKPVSKLLVSCQAELLCRLTLQIQTHFTATAKQTPKALAAAMLQLMLVEGDDAAMTIELLLEQVPQELTAVADFLRAAAAEEKRVLSGEVHSRSKTNGSAHISAPKVIRTEDRTVPFVSHVIRCVHARQHGGTLQITNPHWLTDYVSPLMNLRTPQGLISHEVQRGACGVGTPGLIAGILANVQQRRDALKAAKPAMTSDELEAALLKDTIEQLKGKVDISADAPPDDEEESDEESSDYERDD